MNYLKNSYDVNSWDLCAILISKFGISWSLIKGKDNCLLCAKQSIRFFIYNSQFLVTANKVGILPTTYRWRLWDPSCKNQLSREFSNFSYHLFICLKQINSCFIHWDICVSITDWKGHAVIPKSVEIPEMTEYMMGHWSKRSLSRMGWWSRNLESVKENLGNSRI